MGLGTPFATLFVRPHAFGVIAGVRLPDSKEPVPAEVLARLHPAEREAAAALLGYRQPEWVGARLAWHAAAGSLGRPLEPLLSGPEHQPLGPAGVAVSLSHKRDLAVALVGPAQAGALGVDLEGDGRSRLRVAEKVLREEERVALAALSPERQWLEVMVRFAVKEAIYKAVHPVLRRYVGFHEASVEVDLSALAVSEVLADFTQLDGTSAPRAVLRSQPEPRLECVAEHAGGRVLAAVRARW